MSCQQVEQVAFNRVRFCVAAANGANRAMKLRVIKFKKGREVNTHTRVSDNWEALSFFY